MTGKALPDRCALLDLTGPAGGAIPGYGLRTLSDARTWTTRFAARRAVPAPPVRQCPCSRGRVFTVLNNRSAPCSLVGSKRLRQIHLRGARSCVCGTLVRHRYLMAPDIIMGLDPARLAPLHARTCRWDVQDRFASLQIRRCSCRIQVTEPIATIRHHTGSAADDRWPICSIRVASPRNFMRRFRTNVWRTAASASGDCARLADLNPSFCIIADEPVSRSGCVGAGAGC